MSKTIHSTQLRIGYLCCYLNWKNSGYEVVLSRNGQLKRNNYFFFSNLVYLYPNKSSPFKTLFITFCFFYNSVKAAHSINIIKLSNKNRISRHWLFQFFLIRHYTPGFFFQQTEISNLGIFICIYKQRTFHYF